MTTTTSKKRAWCKTFALIPVFIAAFFVFSANTSANAAEDSKPLFDEQPAEKGFRNYVMQKIIYPVRAQRDSVSGIVFVEFIIDTDGSLIDAKSISNIDPLLETEVLRVINSSPKWTPGMRDGKAIRVKYAFPVRFYIQGQAQTVSSSKNVELSTGSLLLEEVIVVGFGVQRSTSTVSK